MASRSSKSRRRPDFPFCGMAARRKGNLSPTSRPKTVILTQVRTQFRRPDFANPGNSLRRRLGPGLRRDDGGWGGNFHKTYPRPSFPSDNALGFRDGRHGPCHLCPETSGACPRLGDDIPMLRQGVRPGRGALNDRPHLPGALESGWRQPGKPPQAGCRGHHGHRRPATRTPRCPPASRFLPPPPQSRAELVVCAEAPASSLPHRRHPPVAATPRSGGPALPRRKAGRGPPDRPGVTVMTCWRN